MKAKPNKNRIVETLTWAASLLLFVPGSLAANAPEARDVRPGYARSQAQRPATPAPDRRAPLPEPLRRKGGAAPEGVAKTGGSDRSGAAATRPRGDAAKPGSDRDPRASRNSERPDRLAERARSAAVWAAERQLATRGKAEYYRAGFFLGQRDALEDMRIGAWDFREGRHFALRDPEARRAGRVEGEALADELAWSEAEGVVRAQFMNLNADPRFEPRLDAGSAIPAFVGAPRPLPAPTLREVFAAFPVSAFAFANGRPDYVAGLAIDVVRLSGCAAYTDFFDHGWDDPGVAFRNWLDHPARSRFFRALRDPEDRRRFRAVFGATFVLTLERLGERALIRAYDRGFDDGFDYGAFVHRELDYRLGYFEGFSTALDRATEVGLRRAFPRTYEQAYTTLFDEWSDNPKPAIGEVRLVDAGGDGVFEPGERVIFETELINYGGRDGRFPIRVDGSVLVSGGASERTGVLPARSIEWDRRLSARIQTDTPNRTRTTLAVRLADQSATLPLAVSFPLQFVRGSLYTVRRNLQGEVLVEIDVENQSSVPRDGAIEVISSATRGVVARAEVAELGAGRTTTLSLPVRGLPVLDLIAGDVTLDLRVASRGVEQDAVAHRVPDVARDLNNDDLLDYVVSLSRDRHASPREVARARSLFLLRLREDWSRAARRSGNPYKADYRRGGTNTALGELVQTVATSRGDIGNRDVFGGLSGEIYSLAGDLPGAHPFLRKYMRRLARKLP